MFDLIDDLKQIECPLLSVKNNEMADKTGFPTLAITVPDSCFPSYVFWFWLQPVTKVPRGRPSPRWGAEENGKKQAETVGRDKGSLTEQQTEGTVTTRIQKRGIHKTNPQNRPALSDRTAAVPS